MNEFFGIITIVLALITYLPYLIKTIKKQIYPHPFTWTIWGTVTLIANIAQVTDGAGPGAWMNTLVIALHFIIIGTALKINGMKDIVRFDVVVFILALSAIPLWQITKDPLGAVILVSFANTLAFIPNYRKFYSKPYQETLWLYTLNIIRHSLSIVAMAHYSIITVLFPASIVVSNIVFLLYLIWRRQSYSQTGYQKDHF